MSSIFVEPAKLEVSAQRIADLQQQYYQQVQRLYEEVEKMSLSWSGADNLAFVNQINGFNDDFQNMLMLLRQYGEFLATTARSYRQTCEELASLAKGLIS